MKPKDIKSKTKRTLYELVMGSRAYSKGIERKKAPKKLNVLSKYTKETSSPSLQGASGADREELEKRFFRRKK